MADLKELLHNVIGNFENSLQTRYEIWKLKAFSKSAEITSSLLSFLIVLFISGVAFLILSFGLAYWIGSVLRNTGAGFFIIGGSYIILCILLVAFRKKIIKAPLKNHLLDKIIG